MGQQSSIKRIFHQANALMFLLAVIPLVISIFIYSRQIFIYQQSIDNIQEANAISSKVNTDVLEELWDLAFGRISIGSYERSSILSEIRTDIEHIEENTATLAERNTLEVAFRTLDTLEDYQAQVIQNIADEEPMKKNEEIMVQIDDVTQLLYGVLQDFVKVEIDLAGQKNQEIIRSITILSAVEGCIFLFIIYFVYRNKRSLNKNIQEPIDQLITLSNELAVGHLGYRAELPEVAEMQVLTKSMNKMADDLNELLEENALKQYHLAQSEVRVLQAQITPHFVYNSLDALLSLIEQERYEEAKDTTYALSDFFRISLSKGQDWITVEKEIRHIDDYLTILKIRYGEMLNFQINCPEHLRNVTVLKMILQPLVENAVYHGTKHVRRVGEITVVVEEDDVSLYITVQDNGIGMTSERLAEVNAELDKGIDSDFSEGYGLYNVNKRLLLYYGRNAGITIESQHDQGTRMIVKVPKKS